MDTTPDLFLADAAGRRPPNLVSLTVRELLHKWHARRRGYWIVENIQQDLAKYGLTTHPDFTEGWIDNTVTLIPPTINELVDDEEPTTTSVEDEAETEDRSTPDVSLQVSSLKSANTGVVAVSPQDTLEKAQSLMMSHDFSQLPVLSGVRQLRGAVSWESIAHARMREATPTLAAATISAETVRWDDDLLVQIPRIAAAGFAFVQAQDQTFSGIVTTVDISLEFALLATPFFMLAEIERRLRRAIGAAFTNDQLKGMADPADIGRVVESVDDLTMGEYVRLLENPLHWEQMQWTIDRAVFLDSLRKTRDIRNEIMHFSPDPLDEEQINQLATFRKLLRNLDPTP